MLRGSHIEAGGLAHPPNPFELTRCRCRRSLTGWTTGGRVRARARLGEQRGAFFHVAECINNRRAATATTLIGRRTTGGVAEFDSDGRGRTDGGTDGRRLTMMEPFAARRKARGKGIERGRHWPTSLHPSHPREMQPISKSGRVASRRREGGQFCSCLGISRSL